MQFHFNCGESMGVELIITVYLSHYLNQAQEDCSHSTITVIDTLSPWVNRKALVNVKEL